MSTEKMSSRERVLAALVGGEVDRVPWSPCIDGYFLGGVDQVDGFRRLGADAMLRHLFNFIGNAPFRISVPVPGKTMPWTMNIRKVGDETEATYETPVGTLMERTRFNPESPNIPWTTRHRLQTVEDVKILTWMCERAEFVPMGIFFDQAEEKIGDDGVTTISILGTPMLWLINGEAVVDKFWYLYFDHTEEMEALFEAGHQMILRMCRAAAEGPGRVVIQYDNLSSSLCSPRIWEKYAIRWINDYADALHAGDKVYLMHACGHLLAFGETFKKLRIDGFVDIATPPTGTLPDLKTARELWGPEKFAMGGIDATAQVGMTPGQLKEHTIKVLQSMGDGRRMALGTNDAVPKNTTWENLEAIGEAVREAGEFPLGG
jgi:uroporphyrinogen-III decarboxylase